MEQGNHSKKCMKMRFFAFTENHPYYLAYLYLQVLFLKIAQYLFSF